MSIFYSSELNAKTADVLAVARNVPCPAVYPEATLIFRREVIVDVPPRVIAVVVSPVPFVDEVLKCDADDKTRTGVALIATGNCRVITEAVVAYANPAKRPTPVSPVVMFA
jgi:hypothetical protein